MHNITRQSPSRHAQAFEIELLKWWLLYAATIRGSRYKTYAEDVASIQICKMVRRASGGRESAPCPKGLPHRFKQEAFKVAQKVAREADGSNMDWELVSIYTPDDRDGPINLSLMKSLELIFTTTEIEKMLDMSRMGETGHKDLARAIGVSERTLRSRLHAVRSL